MANNKMLIFRISLPRLTPRCYQRVEENSAPHATRDVAQRFNSIGQGQTITRMRPIIACLRPTLFFCAILVPLVSAEAAEKNGKHNSGQLQIKLPPDAATISKILKKYCARCHSETSLQNVDTVSTSQHPPNLDTDLHVLAREPELISPGNADASLLYNAIVSGHMPSKTKDGKNNSKKKGAAAVGPSSQEVAALRRWVQEQKPTQGCQYASASNKKSDHQKIHSIIIANWLRYKHQKASDLRFVALGHLKAACASDNDLIRHRYAIAKIFNSLSWQKAPVTLQQVDHGGSILAVDLNELGWSAATWKWLSERKNVRTGLPAANISSRSYAKIQERTKTVIPVVAADWLAATVLDPDVYNRLLKSPATIAELKNQLGLHDDTSSIKFAAAVSASKITSGPRFIARRKGRHGFAWQAYDFAAKTSKAAVFTRPDKFLLASQDGHQQDAETSITSERILFQLPNGFIGTYLSTNPDSPKTKVSEPNENHLENPLRAGFQCFSCHRSPVIGFADELRAYKRNAQPKQTTENSEAKQATKHFASPAHIRAIIEDDRYSYERALKRARIDTTQTLNSEDPIFQLARRYEADLDLFHAAADVGLTLDRLRERLTTYNGQHVAIARRLLHSSVSRQEFDLLTADLSNQAPFEPRLSPVIVDPFMLKKDILIAARQNISRSGLSVWTQAQTFKRGDPITIHAQAHRDCHMTLVNVDQKGFATVLFPNGFESESFVKAGERLTVPGRDAKYRLTLSELGKESIIAICTPEEHKTPPGIKHKFAVHKFTILGSWQDHLSEIVNAFGGHVSATKASQTQKDKKRRRRSRRNRKNKISDPVPQARNAIWINVE